MLRMNSINNSKKMSRFRSYAEPEDELMCDQVQ